MLRFPAPGECPEYYFNYVELAPKQGILESLASEMERTQAFLKEIPAEAETFSYQPGKWSIREAVGHVIDVERVFANRAFHFARSDPQPLPGMDQDEYNAASRAAERPLKELAAEMQVVRAASLALFRGFSDEEWTREGTGSGYRFQVRAFPYIMVGHEMHHRAILRDRYLAAFDGSS